MTGIPSITASGAVIDALVALCSSVDIHDRGNLEVGDGWLVTNDTGDYLMIGIEDPDQPGAETSAETVQVWPHVGHQVADEEGEITCVIQSWNGDGYSGAKTARDRAITIGTALSQALMVDPSLGLPSPAWTRLGSRMQLNQAQTEYGAVAQLTFRIWFRARLTLT